MTTNHHLLLYPPSNEVKAEDNASPLLLISLGLLVFALKGIDFQQLSVQ